MLVYVAPINKTSKKNHVRKLTFVLFNLSPPRLSLVSFEPIMQRDSSLPGYTRKSPDPDPADFHIYSAAAARKTKNGLYAAWLNTS